MTNEKDEDNVERDPGQDDLPPPQADRLLRAGPTSSCAAAAARIPVRAVFYPVAVAAAAVAVVVMS